MVCFLFINDIYLFVESGRVVLRSPSTLMLFVEFQINNLLPQQKSQTYQYMFYKSTKRFSIVIVMAANNLSQKCETTEY